MSTSATPEAAGGDRMVRTLSGEGGISVRAVVGTGLVTEAARRHHTSPTATTALGRTLMGAALLAAGGKSGESVQIQFRGNGPLLGIVATGDDAGHVRGYVGAPRAHPPPVDGELDVHAAVGAGVLTVVRQRPGQQPYTGVVQIVHGTIAQDLTRYLAESEQSNTALALGVQHDERGGVRAAAGFLVEALPGASPEEIDRVEENVRATEAPSELALCGVDAHGLAVRLLDGLGIRETHEMQVGFHCGCDEERVATAARLLGREELERSAREDDPLEIRCRFCGNAYRLGPEELASLLEES